MNIVLGVFAFFVILIMYSLSGYSGEELNTLNVFKMISVGGSILLLELILKKFFD